MTMGKKIGFTGTGVMGASMAGHILDAGHQLFVFNRTKAKAQPLIDRGAVWCETPRAVATESEITLAIVGFPRDVEEVFLGENGLIAGARPGSILVDMTTSSPSLALKLAEEGARKEIAVMDAPVSGGDVGAREARLSIMAGGPEEAFNQCLPIFELMGKNIVYQGPAGSGQHTKMCNQIAIASGMLAVCEALVYAEKSGLDPRKVLQSIEKGAAGSWSLTNLGPRILDGNFAPGFYIKHFIKDMTIALESAQTMGLKLPGLELTLSAYKKLQEAGQDELGTQALFKAYQSGQVNS